MKKYLIFLLPLLISLDLYSQSEHLPGNMATIDVPKRELFEISFTMPEAYTVPKNLKVEIRGDSKTKRGSEPIVGKIKVSGQLLHVTFSSKQMENVYDDSWFYLIFDGADKLEGQINLVERSKAMKQPFYVDIPQIGRVMVSFPVTHGLMSDKLDNDIVNSIHSYKGIKFGSMSKMRSNYDTTDKSFFVTDLGREGIFTYKPFSRAKDDSAMTIIVAGRKYERVFDVVKPEYFGANPNDNLDDFEAVQKALNTASEKGLYLQFSEGTYIIGSTLKAKVVGTGARYKLAMVGKGRGRTIIQGNVSTISGKNLIEFAPKLSEGKRGQSDIEIKDIQFEAQKADRILYVNNVISLQITNCVFLGGEVNCVQIGDGKSDNYGVYIKDCYLNGVTANSGSNESLLRMSARYAEVHNIVTDGGMYGLNSDSDQLVLSGSTFEGAKRAAVYLHGVAGGSHKIYGNVLRPYVGFEPNGRFDGTISCVHIESVASGQGNSSISNNILFVGPAAVHGGVLTVKPIIGTFQSSTDTTLKKIKGSKSGATASVIGYNKLENRLVLTNLSGKFLPGENITQVGTQASAVITSFPPNHSYGLLLTGDRGYNTVTGNQIRGGMEYCVYAASMGNIFTGNALEGTNGFLIENNTQLTGNTIYVTTGKAVKRTKGEVTWLNNIYYDKEIEGLSPQMFAEVSTSQRNSIKQPSKGLILRDTTENKLVYYNGVSWVFFKTE